MTTLAAGLDDRGEVGREAAPSLALAATADLAPAHQVPEIPLGVVVGRLDAAVGDEAPHGVAMAQDVLRRPADPGRAKACGVLELALDHRAQFGRAATEGGPKPLLLVCGRGATATDATTTVTDLLTRNQGRYP